MSIFQGCQAMNFQNVYIGRIPQQWHSGWDLHYCHTALHTNVTAMKITISLCKIGDSDSILMAVYLTVL